jgi:hypothetical protein
MLRKLLIARKPVRDAERVRWRGREVSRIEGLGFIAGGLQAFNAIEDRVGLPRGVQLAAGVAALVAFGWVVTSLSQTDRRRGRFQTSRQASQLRTESDRG